MQVRSIVDKLKLSVHGIFLILKQWRYFLAFIGLSTVVAGILYFIVNVSSLWPIVSSRFLPALDKLSLIGQLPVQAVREADPILLIISLLQGLALALLIYNLINGQKVNKRAVGGSAIATVAASLGLGCSLCGTSLLLPIASLLASSGAYGLMDTLATVFNALAVILGLYAVYMLGFIGYANYQAIQYKRSKSE